MGQAIVIGSGPNGLAAAIGMAEAGHQVTVLESAPEPGGAVRTQELTLPGFHHDPFSAVHPAAAASPVFERMPLERFGLQWVHPEACYAHPLAGGRALLLYPDLDRTAAGLEQSHPADGERWREFAAPFVEEFDAIRRAMLAGFPPIKHSLRLAAALGPRQATRFNRLITAKATSLGDRLFEGSDARAWLYGSAVHADVPPDATGSAIAVTYLNLLGHGVGWPSPAGGAGRLTDALVGYLESLGGRLECDARVERIDIAHGRVRGVEISGGERRAGDVVIADVMPHALVALTGDALRGTYRSLLRRYRYGPATVKVDWALGGPIPWAAPEVARAGTMHVAGSESELVGAIADSATRLPDRPYLLMGQQSTADPTRAPAGKHTAWAYTRSSAAAVDWAVELPRHVERMEAQVERFAPGFRDLILARHVMGPADLEERNANLVGGDVGGGSYRFPQVLLRPLPRRSPYRTPISGLYLGSAATFPGAAVHGVGGDAAARAALTDL